MIEEILSGVQALTDVLAEGSFEERRIFVRAFVEKITIDPDAPAADVWARRVPQPPRDGDNHGSLSSKVLARTGYEAEKTNILGGIRTRVPLLVARIDVLRAAANRDPMDKLRSNTE